MNLRELKIDLVQTCALTIRRGNVQGQRFTDTFDLSRDKYMGYLITLNRPVDFEGQLTFAIWIDKQRGISVTKECHVGDREFHLVLALNLQRQGELPQHIVNYGENQVTIQIKQNNATSYAVFYVRGEHKKTLFVKQIKLFAKSAFKAWLTIELLMLFFVYGINMDQGADWFETFIVLGFLVLIFVYSLYDWRKFQRNLKMNEREHEMYKIDRSTVKKRVRTE